MKPFTQKIHTALLVGVVLFFGTVNVLSASIIYVDASAGGANNGSSWANAYTDLQDAISAASSGDEIWIAAGVYKPSVQIDLDGDGPDPREVTFQIPNGVMLYGGFAGGEASLEDRDWETNFSILSGDIDNNDVNGDGNHIAENTSQLVGDNAYHVIITESVNAATGIDGIVVTAGYAGNEGFTEINPHTMGGGWHDVEGGMGNTSNPTIRHSRFLGNYAKVLGGAMRIGSYNMGTYEPSISHTTFSGNTAVVGGGAMILIGDAATIDSCLFEHNEVTNFSDVGETSAGAGGAVQLRTSSASFHHCMFVDNHATGNPTGPWEGGGGGAVYISHSEYYSQTFGQVHAKFLNCGFFENTAEGNGNAWGGALRTYCDGGTMRVDIKGSVFAENSASDDGGAIANHARMPQGGFSDPESIINIANSTFHGNVAGLRGGALFNNGTDLGTHDMMSTRTDNSVFYGDEAGMDGDEIYLTAIGINISTHSDIEGSGGTGISWDFDNGVDGGNNIDVNPKFVNAADPLGPDGIGGTSDDGLRLKGAFQASQAVDAGNNWAPGMGGITHEITGKDRIVGGTIDMGAYETYSNVLPEAADLQKIYEWNRDPRPSCRVCPTTWTLVLDPETQTQRGEEPGSHFKWVRNGGFKDQGKYAILEGTIQDVDNPKAQFDVYIKLINPKDWGKWSRAGRTYFVQSQEAWGAAQVSHRKWTFWELSPESRLVGKGDIVGELSLAPAKATTGFQMGTGANALDADLGIGGEFKYSGRVSYKSGESNVLGKGSIHTDMEEE